MGEAVIALIGVMFTGVLGFLAQRKTGRDKFYKSNLSMDEKKTRLLRYYQENYHRARMLMIQNNLGDLVEKHLPFDPPRDLLQDNEEPK